MNNCARSSLTLTRAVLRHSAAQISVIAVCESVGGKVARVPVGNGSGVAAPRGDVAPVLPWYFRSPLPSAGADKSVIIVK
ncbi:hypothetical protein [Escherichia coli]|uniref:hypothetical protein n=1 Tax=Escherichia coli TaxID=562 RepID=UPI0007752100|nr:hypothetical protein [Escherichia coli]EGK4255020.1 hypothetical protein [Escherichia coli]EJB3067451.1 hypothetical protein [Escherichia coli]EJN3593038.1 hypothetical protein [Escherichia coli]EJN3727142.1 hypothetical protein [Escherichia coli]EJN3761865.1 hypothetical protein [Escherichia coli]